MVAVDSPGGRIVVDIGNTRIKWGLLDEAGAIRSRHAWDLAGGTAGSPGWDEVLRPWAPSGRVAWAISSVNPPVAEPFGRWLAGSGGVATWYRSAADVPLESRVREPGRAGADRALAVLAARSIAGTAGPGLVVSCGTALTIERVDSSGVWEGGAIAPGLRAAADAMRRSTAQLPRIEPSGEVAPWGDSTESAMRAGAFWGTVGGLRELVARQGEGRWRIWTGGDSPRLAPLVEGDAASPRIVPDLVLRGLALAAFGATSHA